MIITKIFVEVDDFMKEYEPKMYESMMANCSSRIRRGKLSLSEIMSILIYIRI